jgi:hypothetical protein
LVWTELPRRAPLRSKLSAIAISTPALKSGHNFFVAELRRLIRSPQEARLKVVKPAPELTERTQKLFHFEAECRIAGRAPDIVAGLHPSGLLPEFVKATRTPQWKEIRVLVATALDHVTAPPPQSAQTYQLRTQE